MERVCVTPQALRVQVLVSTPAVVQVGAVVTAQLSIQLCALESIGMELVCVAPQALRVQVLVSTPAEVQVGTVVTVQLSTQL